MLLIALVVPLAPGHDGNASPVCICGAVVSQAALAWEMRSPLQSLAWPSSLRYCGPSSSKVWEEKNVILQTAVVSYPRWSKLPLLHGKIHVRMKEKSEDC